MAIETGAKLPGATLLQLGENGPEAVDLTARLAGRKVVIFGLPGAFTGTCSTAHVPSFIRTKSGFDKAGVDEIICISVNDPWVMQAWGADTGASAAGITMLADAGAEYTKGTGLAFTAPQAGFYDRTLRHALYAEDGVVTVLHQEVEKGVCDLSGGESMLAAITAL